MSATSSGLKSKLRETLKQEDAALAETQPGGREANAAQPRVLSRTPRSLPPPRRRRPPRRRCSRRWVDPLRRRSVPRQRCSSLPRPPQPGAATRAKGRARFVLDAGARVQAHQALREALGEHGVLVSKSALLRAGLALLAERDTGEIARLVAALPKVAKGKRKNADAGNRDGARSSAARREPGSRETSGLGSGGSAAVAAQRICARLRKRGIATRVAPYRPVEAASVSVGATRVAIFGACESEQPQPVAQSGRPGVRGRAQQVGGRHVGGEGARVGQGKQACRPLGGEVPQAEVEQRQVGVVAGAEVAEHAGERQPALAAEHRELLAEAARALQRQRIEQPDQPVEAEAAGRCVPGYRARARRWR